MELHHPIMSKLWDLGGRTKRKKNKVNICENKTTPLSHPILTTNTQACAASIQVYYGAKAEEINDISRRTVAPIEVNVTRNDDPMVVL